MKGHSYRWEDRKAGLETDKYKPLEGLPAEQRHPLGAMVSGTQDRIGDRDTTGGG